MLYVFKVTYYFQGCKPVLDKRCCAFSLYNNLNIVYPDDLGLYDT